MYKKLLFVVGTVLFGFVNSADCGVTREHYYVSNPTPVQSLADFDISPEVKAVRAAKAKRDSSIKSCDGSKAAMDQIFQTYEKEIEAALNNAYLRRRNQYKQVRVHVSCLICACASEKYAPGWWYRAEGDVRIDCPYAGLQAVDGSCRYHEEINRHRHCDANCTIGNLRKINNGFTVHMKIDKAKGYDRWFGHKFEADYAYTESKLTELAKKDMKVLKALVMQSL